MAAALLAAAWLLGTAAAAYTGGETAAVVAATGLLAAIAFAARPQLSTLLLLPLAATFIALAAWRHETTRPDPLSGVGALNNRGDVTIRGVVDAEPDQRPASRVYRLKVTGVRERGRWTEASGRALVRTPAFSLFELGDVLEIEGTLETPAEIDGFDYQAYLLRRGITSIANYPEITLRGHQTQGGLQRMMARVRSGISRDLALALPEPHASLASGILLGDGGSMPEELRRDMAATGTAHLVAVSGQNVSILAAMIIAAFAWLIGRRPAAAMALVVITGYAMIVGAQPSVVRAAIMGGLYVVAIATGRQHTAPIGLGIAAALMTAVDPQVVHEVSFQLSFAATFGLVVLAPPLSRHMLAGAAHLGLANAPWSRAVSDMFAVSLTASLFTLPISAIAFGRISLVSPVANLLIAPAFLAVAATSAAAAALVAVLPAAQSLAAWTAWPATEYMVRMAGWFASLPLASVGTGGIASAETAIPFYASLLTFTAWIARRPVDDEPARQAPIPAARLVPAIGLAGMMAIVIVVAWPALSPDQGARVSVTTLDVGQGDALLIEDLAGHRVLVDGGPSGEALRAALGRQLPFDGRRIDLVVLTHVQADHVAGLLDVLDYYDVPAVLDSTAASESAVKQAWAARLSQSGATVTTASRGQRIELAGAVLQVLAPDDSARSKGLGVNDHSTVLRLTAGRISFLMTGDLGAGGEHLLMRSGQSIDVDVLKVGHHGSRSSSSPEFLARVTPRVSLISVADGNPHGHPAPEVLQRLDGSLIYRTDERGDITISTDGVRMWVDTDR